MASSSNVDTTNFKVFHGVYGIFFMGFIFLITSLRFVFSSEVVVPRQTNNTDKISRTKMFRFHVEIIIF